MPINPYIVIWIINFLFSRQQRVIANGNMNPFLPIDRGVPQGTIQEPIRFSVMSTLVKFANDLTLLKCFSQGNPVFFKLLGVYFIVML